VAAGFTRFKIRAFQTTFGLIVTCLEYYVTSNVKQRPDQPVQEGNWLKLKMKTLWPFESSINVYSWTSPKFPNTWVFSDTDVRRPRISLPYSPHTVTNKHCFSADINKKISRLEQITNHGVLKSETLHMLHMYVGVLGGKLCIRGLAWSTCHFVRPLVFIYALHNRTKPDKSQGGSRRLLSMRLLSWADIFT